MRQKFFRRGESLAAVLVGRYPRTDVRSQVDQTEVFLLFALGAGARSGMDGTAERAAGAVGVLADGYDAVLGPGVDPAGVECVRGSECRIRL